MYGIFSIHVICFNGKKVENYASPMDPMGLTPRSLTPLSPDK